MEKLESLFSRPGVGAGVPIMGAGVAEFCNNYIPLLSLISLTIGILVGIISMYINVKRLIKERR